MKVLLPILLATGCGFGLTPGAIPCGKHQPSGMDVYVDGTGVKPDAGISNWINAPDGWTGPTTNGLIQQWSGSPYMTCDAAFKTIDEALAIGDKQGFWEKKDETYGFLAGIRLEFINDTTLTAIGMPTLLGETQTYLGVHEMAVGYGNDVFGGMTTSSDYDTTYAPGSPTWSSATVLIHEMTHALESSGFLTMGGMSNDTNDHCHWATKYAPRYSTLGEAQFSSNFHDKCENRDCSGSACSGGTPTNGAEISGTLLLVNPFPLPAGGGSVEFGWGVSGKYDSLSIVASAAGVAPIPLTGTGGTATTWATVSSTYTLQAVVGGQTVTLATVIVLVTPKN